jgi:hypothetical protein
MAKKFIIENNELKVGNVEMHFELAKNESDVCGGGYWHVDLENKILWMYGASIDFGRCKKEHFTNVRSNGRCASSLMNLDWKFAEADSLQEYIDIAEEV